jgi:hypothetical protein
MAVMVSRATLQAATVISKTTETIIGQEVACGGHDNFTLWFSYVKGDETGLNITPYFMWESGGTAFSNQSWTGAAGTRTPTDNVYQVTASGDYYFVIDIRGIEFIKCMQAGSNNDGTPTGTLAAYYTITK